MPNLTKLKIGDFVLDPSRCVLTGAAGETALEPKIVDVLVTLAKQPGVVFSRDELIDAVWKTEFGADERLTRAISLLRKAFHDERGTARYIETLPKRGYRLIAAVETLPPEAPAASNHAQVPPANEAAAPAQPAATASPSRRPTWQAYAIVAGVGVALGLAAIAWSLWRGDDDSAHAKNVVELLPFVLVEGKPGLDAFARQVHASLKRVMTSNAVSLIDGTAPPPDRTPNADAARESEFVLTGSLERVDDRYAVTLYFDHRESGQTLWSRRFTRPIAEAEALREEIGANAAGVIGCGLYQRSGVRRKPPMAAFKIYLELCEPATWADRGTTAIAVTERLTTVAPDDAYGLGLAALVNSMAAIEGHDLSESQVAFYKAAAHKAAARALELDSTNAYAQLANTAVLPGAEYWLGLDAFVERVGADNPLRGIAYWHTASLRQSGRLKEALHVIERAAARAPLSAADQTVVAVMNMQVGDHEKAARLLEATVQLWPDYRTAYWYRLVNAVFYGDPAIALTLLSDTSGVIDLLPRERECWRRFVDARARGAADAADHAAIRELCAGDNQTHFDYQTRMLAALGDIDGAYEMAKRQSFAWRGSTTFLFYPEMAAFRNDARFMPLIAESGLLEYWTKSGHWPDLCADKSLPYDCGTAAANALNDKRAASSKSAP